MSHEQMIREHPLVTSTRQRMQEAERLIAEAPAKRQALEARAEKELIDIKASEALSIRGAGRPKNSLADTELQGLDQLVTAAKRDLKILPATLAKIEAGLQAALTKAESIGPLASKQREAAKLFADKYVEAAQARAEAVQLETKVKAVLTQVDELWAVAPEIIPLAGGTDFAKMAELTAKDILAKVEAGEAHDRGERTQEEIDREEQVQFSEKRADFHRQLTAALNKNSADPAIKSAKKNLQVRIMQAEGVRSKTASRIVGGKPNREWAGAVDAAKAAEVALWKLVAKVGGVEWSDDLFVSGLQL